MPVTKVDICNLAVTHLGAYVVQDIDSPTTKEERVLSVLYPRVLPSVLAAANWMFARKRKALSSITGEETGNFTYAFSLPADCLVPREVVPLTLNTTKKVEFEIAVNDAKTGKILLCDDDAPVLLYTANVENPNLFTPDFIEMLALRIAAAAAKPIKGDKDLAKQLTDDYHAAIAQAFATNANAGHRVISQQNDFLDARL